METPAEELLQHMDYVMSDEEQERERERARTYLQYLISHFTAPSFGEPDRQFLDAKKQFVESIMPEAARPKKLTIEYKWDYELLDKLAGSQEGG